MEKWIIACCIGLVVCVVMWIIFKVRLRDLNILYGQLQEGIKTCLQQLKPYVLKEHFQHIFNDLCANCNQLRPDMEKFIRKNSITIYVIRSKKYI